MATDAENGIGRPRLNCLRLLGANNLRKDMIPFCFGMCKIVRHIGLFSVRIYYLIFSLRIECDIRSIFKSS